jgi:hypothetical protein
MCLVLVIVGNKLDREKYREVSTQEGRDYAQSISSAFFEVSAKTGQGSITPLPPSPSPSSSSSFTLSFYYINNQNQIIK